MRVHFLWADNDETSGFVIGAKGHTGLSGVILGSVASYVAAHSKVPVVIVPHHD